MRAQPRPLLVSLVTLIVLFAGACSQTVQPPSISSPRTPAIATTAPTPTDISSAPPQESPIEEENHAAEVDALFSFITEKAPGAAVLVVRNGSIVYQQGYGLADRRRRSRITPQTAFHLASAGKQFTALGIMMLHAEGKVDYDAPIGAYLPELKGLGEEVTIRRLLQHISGLPGHESNEQSIYDTLLERVSEPTNDDLIALLSEWKVDSLAHIPGERYDYSNPGYEVLGVVIERISGQAFGGFMHERIFGPAGMTGTFSIPNKERLALPNRARGYSAEGEKFELYDSDPLDNLVGSGSIYSTVEDLYRYDQALYTDILVPQTILAEAFKPALLNDGTAYEYGFGWELGEDAGRPYIGHSGSWVGFLSYILRFPDERLSVFVLANRTDVDPEGLAFEIAKLYH